MRTSDGYASAWAQASYCFLQKNEHEAMKKVVDNLSPGSICVNIGAGFGVSGLTFIESDTVGKLYTVELYATAAENGMGNLEYEKGIFERFGLYDPERYEQICGECTAVGRSWNHEKIDMLFLDADHTYEHTYNNIVAWLPHIKSGGIMSFHDYGQQLNPQLETYPGVEQAAKELLINRYKIISYAPTFVAFRII